MYISYTDALCIVLGKYRTIMPLGPLQNCPGAICPSSLCLALPP